MIVTRAPFRISFFGGGTDFQPWYKENGGAVLATTIDKYCYINIRHLPPFFDHKHRIVYSKIESVLKNSEIQHPSVRAVFDWAKVKEGIELHHDGDLPARSGLGSSSSFTVALIQALAALNGAMKTKEQLAAEAIHVEQDIIKEHVGSQDQISAAFGGFNRIDFHKDMSFSVNPVVLPRARLKELQSHLMLFFTGFTRFASDIEKTKIANLGDRVVELSAIRKMVDDAIEILQDRSLSIREFGRLLHEGWLYKRSLSDKVSNPEIDTIYDTAINAGADGGKILGAGGGGFLLVFAQPEVQDAVRHSLNQLIHVPFDFETSGSRVMLYQPEGL
jgi:D-glycero-alpha-D-manno-heptose-7-phosphate kinase